MKLANRLEAGNDVSEQSGALEPGNDSVEMEPGNDSAGMEPGNEASEQGTYIITHAIDGRLLTSRSR